MSSSEGGNGGGSGKGKSPSSITSYQNAQLEAFFVRCPHPDETQQDQLAKDLGLQPERIKEWFENKRTQTQGSQPEPQFPTLDSSSRDAPAPPEQTRVENQPCQDYDLPQSADPNHEVPNSSQSPTRSDVSDAADYHREKSRMLKTAKAALKELAKLVRTSEPLWVKSSRDERFSLDREQYQRMFPRNSNPNVFKTPSTRVESSKASMIVDGVAKKLVEALLDPEEMTELFPTLIQRVEIIKEYEVGPVETKNGALLLMYLELHTLSHLVPSRKYFVLRYCEQIHDSGIWVISDVSLPSFGQNLPHLPSWKLPSGCLIRQMPNENSTMVIWVEHVEANDRPETSLIYEDLVKNNVPYSADMWVLVLQRSCEKLTHYQLIMPDEAAQGRTPIPKEGRMSLLHLSHRMLKGFNAILDTTGKPEITQFSSQSNNHGTVKFSLRKNSAPGQPKGMIATLVTSIWLPLAPFYVFHVLKDPSRRSEWDILCTGSLAFEVAKVGTGLYRGNCVSLIRRHSPDMLNLYESSNELVIFQECSIDPVHSYIVFAPMDMLSMHSFMNGRDASCYEILPSGFSITGDSDSFLDLWPEGTVEHRKTRGTLLTVGYQMLVSGSVSTKDLKMDGLARANTVFRLTINKVRKVLGC